MKKSFLIKIFVGAVVVIGFFTAGPLFVIEEGEQAVVVRMGQIVRVVPDAGLYLRVPIIDEVVRYPTRILTWDGQQDRINTRELQLIWVDITARWRISDPHTFHITVPNISVAEIRLGDIINSEVRNVITGNYFHESVRNSNLIIERVDIVDIVGIGYDIDPSVLEATRLDTDFAPIERGRRQLAEEILARSRLAALELGIELIDVVTRQIRYADEITPSVYARMIAERNLVAQAIRSDGYGRKAVILGQMEYELMTIRSEAYSLSQIIRGAADAEAIRIYAAAHNQDRDFFNFWRALESYRQTLPRFNKTFTTDMDFFRFLHSPR